MAQEGEHFRLRLPADLKQEISDAAAMNNRSINAEIISRLTTTKESMKFDKRIVDLENSVNVLCEMQNRYDHYMTVIRDKVGFTVDDLRRVDELEREHANRILKAHAELDARRALGKHLPSKS